MDGLTKDGLKGQNVAVTGHLACMSHGQAAALIRSFGGIFTFAVNPRTNLLLVGGWPLKADGRLTKKLRVAKELGVTIRTEEEFLADLGLAGKADRRLYNMAELTLLLKMPNERIRRWFAAGWLQPVKEDHGVQFFDVVIDGVRHPRNAWSYEAPQPRMQKVDHRMGFWEDVQVG